MKSPKDQTWLTPGFFAFMVFLLCCLSCKSPQPPIAKELIENSIIIRDAHIVDTATGTVSGLKDILIIEGRITQIEDPGILKEDRIRRRIYADGFFVMPGLINVHAHLGDGGLGKQTDADRIGALAQFVHYGVTTIFVPGGGGGNDDQLIAWKEQVNAGEILGPALYGSGNIITAPGSHPIGTIWGMSADTDPAVIYARGAVALAEDEPVVPLIETKQAKGVDALKIVIEDGPGDFAPKPRLSKTKVAEIVEAAHQRNLRVFAHVSLANHVADGVAAGIDGVMHSVEDPLSEALLKEMAEKGVFFVPTLALYDGFEKQALKEFEEEPYAHQGVSKRALESLKSPEYQAGPDEVPDWLEPIRQAITTNLQSCAKAGVPIALGTDVNNPTVFPGYSAHEELVLMVEAGLTPAEALKAATIGGAAFLEKESQIGKVAIGYQADLLILSGNPLEDIRNTRTLQQVLLNGKVIRQVVSTTLVNQEN